MSKRRAVAVLVSLTGVLFLDAAGTAPVGALLVAVGVYLLVLPRVAGYRSGGGRLWRGWI